MAWQAITGVARRTVYRTGTAATHTYLPNIKAAIIEGIGGGGAGGNVSCAAGNSAAGGGGGAGGYFSVYVTAGLTTCTYTVGAVGAHSGSFPGDGGAGGDTIVVHNGVTYTAKGGLGGLGMAYDTAPASTDTVAAVAGSGGDIFFTGEVGKTGVRLNGTFAISGAGGSTKYGSGGRSRCGGLAAGYNGVGIGAGGAGASSNSVAQAAGDGAAGGVIITEYY